MQNWQLTAIFRQIKQACTFFPLGIASATIPLGIMSPVTAQAVPRFVDIEGHWAQACIRKLAEQDVISGYPDGTFRPSNLVTRAEYAAFVDNAFPDIEPERGAINFQDVPADYWAWDEIRATYRKGFLSGYPGQVFRPEQNIPRAQAFVALASGLDYSPTQPVPEILISTYADAREIPDYARGAIAAATQQNLAIVQPVPEAPELQVLRPNREATRAEIAAAICQAEIATAVVPSEYVAQVGEYETESVSATFGNTEATVYYQVDRQEDVTNLSNAYLQIDRNGQTILSQPLESLPVSFTRSVDVKVEDINGDGELEVIAELVDVGPQGLCCENTNIYRYIPAQNNYTLAVSRNWPFINRDNQGYNLEDLDNNGNPEFESADTRFRAAFGRPLQAPRYIFPVKIWEYRQGALLDVTAEYPNRIESDAYRWWQTAQELQETEAAPYTELKTSLAAYLADKYLLGEDVEGWQIVQDIYQKPDRQEFFTELSDRLRAYGYINE